MTLPTDPDKPIADLSRHLRAFYSSVNVTTSHPVGGKDRVNDMKPIAWENVDWYSKQSPQRKQRFVDFLVRLDHTNCVNPDMPQTQDVREGITCIMHSLSKKLQELEPRFKGQLVPMGSSHNNTKIGDSDEFDFAYEMDVGSIVPEATFKCIQREDTRFFVFLKTPDSNGDLVLFPFPESESIIAEMSVNGQNDSEYYRRCTSFKGDNSVLNTEHVAFAFYLVIYNALSQLQLPPGWSHGGFNRPNFSGIRFNLPSFLLQFEYMSKQRKNPLQLSVDFAPVFKVPALSSDRPDVLNDFLLTNGFVTSSWLRLERGVFKIAHYSHAEEKFLAQYPWQSTAKKLLRICKALHGLSKLSSPKYIPRFCLNELKTFFSQENRDTACGEAMNLRILEILHIAQDVKFLLPDNHLATFKDLGESVGEFEYVTSYILKRSVMTLMALDEDRGHSWTENDLPDLVMSVYMIVNDVMLSINQSMTIPSNEVYSEDGSSLSFDVVPRSDVLTAAGLYGNLPPPVLIGKISVNVENTPQEVHEASCLSHDHNTGETGDKRVFDSKLVKEAPTTLDCANSANQGLDTPADSNEPPKFYTLLKSAITEGNCEWLLVLFLRSKFSLPIKDIGLDLGISQVFQLLQAAFEGKKTASIEIWRGELDEDEVDIRDNIEEYFITKEELQAVVGGQLIN